MKLTKKDRLIIDELKRNNGTLCLTTLSKRLSRYKSSVKRNIDKLAKNQIITIQEGYPKFYKLNFPDEKYKEEFDECSCPKCKGVTIVGYLQRSCTCSFCKKRFYITRTSKKRAYNIRLHSHPPIILQNDYSN